jgi:PAS domain S-box-containing protein
MLDRLADSERHLRELLEALPAAIYTTDAEGRITFFNQAAVDLSGRTPELGSDSWCVTWRLFQTDGTPLPHDECPMAQALKQGRPIRGVEAVAERPDGTRVPFQPYPTPLRDGAGNIVGGVNMLIDISERKQAEQRQKVLIDELNHRVKNTLATVQSLARQTARNTESPRQFVETFEARLMGLARVHELLARSRWEGAALQTLIRDIVTPYVEDGRIRIEGPPVDLNPRSALATALAINELVTNACKYGALSRPAGTLSIAWTVRPASPGRVVDLDWQERGGPTVSPPSRRGFGTRLVERSIEADLSGHVDLRFEPDGLVCRMSIPLSANAPSDFAGHG